MWIILENVVNKKKKKPEKCYWILSDISFLHFVINRSFIGSKLEQTIRIIHMQYSVHTIKVKEIQNLYKTNTGEKSYSLRDTVVKVLSILWLQLVLCTQ